MSVFQKFSRFGITLAVIAGMGLATVPVTALPAHAEEATTEATTSVDFVGQLVELSTTSTPTTIVVRENPTGEFTDYTVNISNETKFGSFKWNTTAMEDWMTGDSVRIIGEKNENTGLVDAEYAINESLNPLTMQGLNGWIDAIDTDANTITVQWMNVEHLVHITDDTHLVISPNTKASLSDFQIGDRVRVRMNKNGEMENEARFVVALRRGANLFLKARTRPVFAEVNSITVNEDGTGSMQVTIGENPQLLPGDVNNLFGVEGDVKTVTFGPNTKFVRRFNGNTEAGEIMPGDQLLIVGRANDDNSISAWLIKDSYIWVLGVSTHEGTVESVDTATNTIVMSTENKDGEMKDVTVTYDDNAYFIAQGGTNTTENDIAVGDTIRVRGQARRDSDSLVGVEHVTGIWIKAE